MKAPLVCVGAPCRAQVAAATYLRATSPDFPASPSVPVPNVSEVRVTVNPGARWKEYVAAGLTVLALGEVVSGSILVDGSRTGAPGRDVLGASLLVGGVATGVLAFLVFRGSRTELTFLTPDAQIHF